MLMPETHDTNVGPWRSAEKRQVLEEPESEEAVTDYTSINRSGSCLSCNDRFYSRRRPRAFSGCGCAQECIPCVELNWATLLSLETPERPLAKRCRICNKDLTEVPGPLPNQLPVKVFVDYGQYSKLVKKPR